MRSLNHKTKIVSTIGPASASPEILRKLIEAGMSVARLNFSHGSYDEHARVVSLIRAISQEIDNPITILQDLQGPKIRVGNLPNGAIDLVEGMVVNVVPMTEFNQQLDTIPIDYPHLAEEAEIGTQLLLDDGLLELSVKEINHNGLTCEVVRGGLLKNRKGVNVPSLNLRLPSLTKKDKQDLEFGITLNVDWVSLSFVRTAADICTLKELLKARGTDIPVIAKLEKPQAIAHLESILDVCDGVMVARGDLGVELSPEKVPMVQKHVIRRCNQRGIPVITATQMLESMIHNPRPTRAEASDVANAIVDGSDAVMLSGETSVGKYPVQAVQMMARIASTVEKDIEFPKYPPAIKTETHAITEALNAIEETLDLRCIVAFTSTGFASRLAAAERLKTPIIAVTPSMHVYHQLNLIWGLQPLLIDRVVDTFEQALKQVEECLIERNFAKTGDRIVVMGGIPMGQSGGTNFLKIHTVGN